MTFNKAPAVFYSFLLHQFDDNIMLACNRRTRYSVVIGGRIFSSITKLYRAVNQTKVKYPVSGFSSVHNAGVQCWKMVWKCKSRVCDKAVISRQFLSILLIRRQHLLMCTVFVLSFNRRFKSLI